MSMTFGERLRAARIERGITEAEVARELGLTQGAISKFEHGIREPAAGTLVALAKFFGLSIDYLVGNEIKQQAKEVR